jgi:hypothetical protein
MVKVINNDSVPVMSHIESSIINRCESEVKIERSRDCSTKRNEICNSVLIEVSKEAVWFASKGEAG